VAAGYNLSALAVLVADKNLHMRRIVRSILRELNIRMVTEASTPEDALELLLTKPFDLAFIEWAPDFDGNATVRQLRRDAKAASRFIPVIITSAYTEVQHVITSRDAGADQFLAKPFTANLIFQHLKGVVEGQRSFVRVKSFFGPDRRRKKKPPPDGLERRGVKPKDAASNPDAEKSEPKDAAPKPESEKSESGHDKPPKK
jgi:DNA-binding response OmpR family regulator